MNKFLNQLFCRHRFTQLIAKPIPSEYQHISSFCMAIHQCKKCEKFKLRATIYYRNYSQITIGGQ